MSLRQVAFGLQREFRVQELPHVLQISRGRQARVQARAGGQTLEAARMASLGPSRTPPRQVVEDFLHEGSARGVGIARQAEVGPIQELEAP